MSLTGAMNSAVSALQAQSAQLSLISNNLANSSTTGYKTVNASFSDVLSGVSTATTYYGGGVTTSALQNVTTQGTIGSGTETTDLAIDGNGMFVVASTGNTNDVYYTRDGEFTPDANGNLVLDGKYDLMGWPLDADGNVESANTTSTTGLSVVNVDRYSSAAQATSTVTLAANLPSDASTGASFTSSVSVYDSLGEAQTVPTVWTKTGSNSWSLTLDDPTDSSGAQSGTLGGTTTYSVDFNSDGSLASISDANGNAVTDPTITFASLDDGASTSDTVNISMGTAGSKSGLTQLASGETTPSIDVTTNTQDGYAYSKLKSVAVGTDGTVTATYSSGQTLAIYKVPLATFANEDGLAAQSDNVYTATEQSGGYSLETAGTGGAGTIDGSSLESSTVDTSTEFSLMITAQQAYSAASQVISTAKQMYDSLLQAANA
jgi:flagellar hook protein FlgE